MLEVATGLVLRQTKYSETSLIVSVLTLEYGKRSFIIGHVRGAKKNKTAQYFVPGSYIRFTAYPNKRSNLHRIKETEFVQLFDAIRQSATKSAIVLFVTEILSKSLKENYADTNLFNFLISMLELLETETKRTPYFLYMFLTRLAKYQGFFPLGNYSEQTPVFDLQAGIFRSDFPIHTHYVQGANAQLLGNLFAMDLTEFDQLELQAANRLDLLESLLVFYRIHFEGMSNIKSFEVLKQVFF